LRPWVIRILEAARGDDVLTDLAEPVEPREVDAWEAIIRTRADDRPGPLAVLELMTERTDLRGTTTGESDGGIRVALGRLRGRRVVVVAQTREAVTPAGLRVAQRGMRLAQRLELPLVTLVDTPGGELSAAAEESAMAGEIARTLQTMSGLSTPTVSCIVGQGCGGAALALIPADVVLCMENGWVSPLPPEGASVISHRTPERADEMARMQGVAAAAMREADVVDQVVGEGDDLAACVADAVVRALT
jgi:acetyl-CoA carboxylase carboxyl transferase subunit beta